VRLLDGFKKRRGLFISITSVLLLIVVFVPILFFLQQSHVLNNALSGIFHTQPELPTGPSAPGKPTLQRLEQVTDQAFGDGNNYVPNSWGQQKNRIIRTSTGDIFMVYNSQGSDDKDREWHLMHRSPNGGWQEIKSGNAGTEPINIVRGPNDEIHVFALPGTNAQVQHLESTDLGKTWTSEMLPGKWSPDQGYIAADVNTQGDIVVVQTGDDIPGAFYWCYYSPDTGKWQFHTTALPIRYTYAFAFPDTNNGIAITGIRDALRHELGYQDTSDGSFNYIFNQLKYFYIGNVNSNPTLTQQVVLAQVEPQNVDDADITYMTDSYMDTQGRVHVLYFNLYDNLVHHIIIENGQKVKEVKQNIDYGDKARIFQDALGHYYIISTSQDGNTMNIYQGTASDTDGTQLLAPVKLNIAQFPGCSDYDFCHSPNLTIQRSGHTLSNYIDGVYGNHTKEIYFRINLR